LVVRKESVRVKRDGGAKGESKVGRFKGAEMGTGSKDER
jgi:hypothetical protein